jgi:Winged helix DNA-binding domain
MTLSVSIAQRRARLTHRHLLIPAARTDDVAAIADALVAVHSSDPVTAHLSVLARMAAPSIDATEAALYTDRVVLRHHAMRRTLWVATPELTRQMHAAATRKLVGPEHRRTAALLATSGIADPEAWLRDARAGILAALQKHGPATARDLGRLVPELAHPLVLAPGKSYSATVAAHTRVLLLLGFEAALIRTRPVGSWVSGQYTWASMHDWVPGGIDDAEERDACAALARAWLHRFGPGSTADLAWWAGWTLATTRRALADNAAVEVDLDGGTGWLLPDDLDPVPDPDPWVAVLPGLDPTVMGWKDRSWYLPAAAVDAFDRNGNAGPTIWVDGQVVGAWAQRPDGEIRLHWFTAVPARRRAQVEQRAAELGCWVGDTRFTVRFPGRVQARLLA